MLALIRKGLLLFFLTIPHLIRAQYCTPIYVNDCIGGDYIHTFSINTLHNKESGCSANNYIEYSTSEYTTNLEQGSSYEVMVNSPGSIIVRVYFDFNKDLDFNDAGEFFLIGEVRDSAMYSTISIPSNVSGEVRMRVRGAINDDITTDDTCDLKDWGEAEDYTVNIVPPYAMSYFDNEVIKDTTYTPPGSSNQKMIRVSVLTSGSLSPINVSQLNFNTNGTTDPGIITNARVYYTGASRNFSTTTSFGAAVNSPDGSFTFTGNQSLIQGRNFFWLTYDIHPTAPLNEKVGAAFISFIAGGSSHTPSAPQSEGSREILKIIKMQNGSATAGTIDLVDDGGVYGNYSSTDYKLTLFPEDPGSVLSVEFNRFNLCAISEIGCDEMIILDGNAASEDTLYSGYNMPGSYTSTASGGSLTFIFLNTTNYDPRGLEPDFVGWSARITNVPNVAISTATISGNSTISPGQSGTITFTFTGTPPYTVVYTNGSKQDTLKNISSATHSLSTSIPGTYTIVKFTDGLSRNGSFSGSAIITLTEPDILKAPEGFSPNGDSFNDIFYVQGIKNTTQISLHVYNRDGNLIYSAENYKNDWDGKTSDGDALPDGTYYYVITTKDKSKTLKSYVEIRR